MAGPNLIIGLGHRKRVGKDTFAGFLDDELAKRGYSVYKLAFASAMKSTAADIFGDAGLRDGLHYEVNPEHREIPLPKIGKTPRQLWIELGNAVREIYPNTWVDIVKRVINVAAIRRAVNMAKPCAFIITDVRFPNEAAAVKSWGGVLVKVARPDAPVATDSAEVALDGYHDWDHGVLNDGTLGELKAEAVWLANNLTNKP